MAFEETVCVIRGLINKPFSRRRFFVKKNKIINTCTHYPVIPSSSNFLISAHKDDKNRKYI